MTAVFEKHNLQFMYPENWTLVEDDDVDEFVEVSLESPEGGIWSVSKFTGGQRLADLLDCCAQALADQYEDFEKVDIESEIDGFQVVGFDSHFYCLDFLVAAQARAIVIGGLTLNIYCQAESREFDKNRKVFDAITLSLLRSFSSH